MDAINELNERYSGGDAIRFGCGRGNLPRALITTDQASAEIYLHGAHVTAFEPRDQNPVLFLSENSFFQPDKSIRGGDHSFREIPDATDVSKLIESHRSESFDHAGINADPNLGFPIDRARELAKRGRIGSLSRRQLSFMGSITAPGRLIQETAPAAARLLVEDAVDLALLVPV